MKENDQAEMADRDLAGKADQRDVVMEVVVVLWI